MSAAAEVWVECPHCKYDMPAHFAVCGACVLDAHQSREGWQLWVALKTAQGVEHLHTNRNTLSPWLTAEQAAARVAAAFKALLGHLRLHASNF